ncbi:TPA: ead/Ea22-like family protein [Klebsiella pneumoniae subsp. pneumoniae]|nr:ead/Ea22-like family protein [Klebsiella pneumoniae subsp. pneumoniae]
MTELAQRMKAAAEKATPGPWYVHDKPCEDGNYGIDTSDKEFLAEAVVWWGFARQSIWREEDAKYIALANPANILALVEALEKAQGMEAYWKTQCRGITDHCEELQARIAGLESRTVTAAAADVLAERQRQVTAEGWTTERDDGYQNSELADAAACYAIHAHNQGFSTPAHWPWSQDWWKQTSPRRDLVKAGALILAEIERLDRAAGIKVEAE